MGAACTYDTVTYHNTERRQNPEDLDLNQFLLHLYGEYLKKYEAKSFVTLCSCDRSTLLFNN